ncbi:uncharacterized protein FFB14_08263 [Fusarium fujikuroi]|nr:uncharacterized protein FFB14_08263 [Fusarium fujikuroi]
MAEHGDTRPTSSPYASGTCAVYFECKGPLHISRSLLPENLMDAAQFRDNDDSAYPLCELWLDEITPDVGHVIIHYLVTGTYQCLKSEEKDREDKISAELATAIRVGEIVRLGDQLTLTPLINVMEKAALSFDENPGIATYVESRLLSFSQIDHVAGLVDQRLAALGAPDTLSKVLLRSILLSKASESRQLEEPTYQASLEYPGVELRPTKQAMERAESVSLRTVEAASDEEELGRLQQKTELSPWDRLRLYDLEHKAEKRAKEIATERELDAQRCDASNWSLQQPLRPEAFVDGPVPDPPRPSSKFWKPKAFEGHGQCDNETHSDSSSTDELTPGSVESSSMDEVCCDW